MVQAHQLGRLLRGRLAALACGMVCDTARARRLQQNLPSLRFFAESSSTCSSSRSRRRGWYRFTSSDTYFDVDSPLVSVRRSVTLLLPSVLSSRHHQAAAAAAVAVAPATAVEYAGARGAASMAARPEAR